MLKTLLIVFLGALSLAGCQGLTLEAGLPIDNHTVVEVKMAKGGHGSGVIIGPNLVATAGHVAASDFLLVVDDAGKEYKVKSKSIATTADFAIITIEGTFEFAAAPVACEYSVKPLDRLYVVGYPLDFPRTIYELIAVDYYIQEGVGKLLLGTGVSLPGNSGGPVFNSSGEVVGILTGEYMVSDGIDTDVNTIVPIGEGIKCSHSS